MTRCWADRRGTRRTCVRITRARARAPRVAENGRRGSGLGMGAGAGRGGGLRSLASRISRRAQGPMGFSSTSVAGGLGHEHKHYMDVGTSNIAVT